jgi:hypothetical protein
VREVCELNAIPYAVVDRGPQDPDWVAEAREAVESFLRPST